MDRVRIHEVLIPKRGMYDALCPLVRQLSPSIELPTWEDYMGVVADPSTRLLVASDGRPLGMLTLITARTVGGLHILIEDFVVDETHRGLGIGRQLIDAALAAADARHGRSVELTSAPARIAANNLYRALGFVRRDTNVYEYTLPGRADDPSRRRPTTNQLLKLDT